MKKIAGIILFVLAIAILYVGITKTLLPPIITGIGFIVIGIVYLSEKR